MNNIAILRKQFGLSQKEFGKKVGVAQNTVCNWEKGNREPDNESLRKMSELFNVSIDYILCREEKKEEPSVVDEQLESEIMELVDLASRLDDEQLDAIMSILRTMVKSKE